MSVVSESPVNSSSSDDFAALLDAELDTSSSDQESHDCDDENIERIKRRKVENLDSIEEVQCSTSYVLSKKNSGVGSMLTIPIKNDSIRDSCTHPGTLKDLCILCGEKMVDGAGVAFGYIHKDLRLGSDEISRLRNADVTSLIRHKKLYLVLDLDHTLLNSTMLEDISSDEEYLLSQTDSLEDVSKGSLFRMDKIRMMTKLRPFVRTFLQEASSMFEMYIYTMGERAYAMEMANLLDPQCLYFNSRVISQADCTQRHQKGLDVVLGQESAALILDDTEAVWQRHKDNLISMERYHFFSSSCRQFRINCKSLSQLKNDENEGDGALATVLGVLKRIHSKFFDSEQGDDYAARDVRQLLKIVRMEILKDCKLVFSKVFPMGFPAESNQFWKMAEQMGATCSTVHDSSITHVVSTDAGTVKSRWAIEQGLYLVHPRWIEAAYLRWQRQPEDQFPVIATKSK